MDDKFYRYLREEQETIITFDYEDRLINVYTNQINAMKRIYNIFYGKFTTDDIDKGKKMVLTKIDKKIASIDLYIPFSDRESYKKALSINTILYKAK